VEDIEASIFRTNFKKNSFGISGISGLYSLIYADFVANNRTIQNPGGVDANGMAVVDNILPPLWKLTQLAFFSIFFGGIFFFDQEDPKLTCGSADIEQLLDTYNLLSGISGCFPTMNAAKVAQVSSQISEFKLLSSSKLNCVSSKETSILSAAEVGWTLEELIPAMNLRLELEMKDS